MAQLNNNGIATHNEDMSDMPFGNYIVRGTYPENTHYKGSNSTAVIHHYPSSSDERTCNDAEDFCEYTPSTYFRGDAGENITEDQLCAVADNQFIVADMKNSTSMEVLIGILEGQQTELENTRIYLLHGPNLQVYCEKDATDGYLHIHYTHPTNPAYANINVATTLDFTEANKFTFTIDDGGCCTLRIWNQNSNGDGTWSTTLDYTYTFPSEYVLQPDDVWATSTGVYTTNRVLVEAIDYEYNYTPHKVINCRDGTNWRRIGNYNNLNPISPAIFDNYGYVKDRNTSGNDMWASFCNIPLTTFTRIEVELQERYEGGTYPVYWAIVDPTQMHTKNIGLLNGVTVSIPNNKYKPRVRENHQQSTMTDLTNAKNSTTINVTFVITGDRHIVYKDGFGNRWVSSQEYSLEDIRTFRFLWQSCANAYTDYSVSVTKCRIYEDFSAIDPAHVP